MKQNIKLFLLNLTFSICLTSVASQNKTKNISLNLNNFRLETTETGRYLDDGLLSVKSGLQIKIRLYFNTNLNNDASLSFTHDDSQQGSVCNKTLAEHNYKLSSVDGNTILVEIKFGHNDPAIGLNLRICLKENEQSSWIHQGNSPLLSLKVEADYSYIILIVQAVLIPFLLLLSGLLSALALNLLSLTKSELRMLRNQGTFEEKKYSKVVTPLRKRGNVLFCSLLLMNTLVNVLIAVLFHDLVYYWSVLAATLLIVFLGEIIPQTLCSRFGLLFNHTLAWLTNIIVILTFPFSYPLSQVLDWMLNDEVPMVYNRDRFQELMAKNQILEQNDLPKKNTKLKSHENFEELSNKTVGDIMLTLDNTYMEEYEALLNEDKVAHIIKSGFTRIPIFKNSRSNVVALLHLNDLKVLDTSDELSIKALCMYHNRPVNFVFEDTKLDVILEEFKKGQSHMAIVQKVNNEGPGDPYYETVGMVTLDDVISEIFKSDHKSPKNPDNEINFLKSTNNVDRVRLSMFKKSLQTESNGLSHNQLKALSSFLSQVPAFQENKISAKVLEKLLNQSQLLVCKEQPEEETEENINKKKITKSLNHVIVEKGKALKSFIIVLEGEVSIEIGADDFIFEGRAFDHFGLPVLNNSSAFDLSNAKQANMKGDVPQSDYIPDYTVKPHPQFGTTCLIIHQSDYASALQTTFLKKMNENFDNDKKATGQSEFEGNVSQQQQMELQLLEQQQELESQLREHQQLQEQLEQHQEQMQQELMLSQIKEQMPYNNIFINPSYIESMALDNKASNITIVPPTTGFNEHDDDDDRHYDDDVEDYKDGLISKSNDCLHTDDENSR